MFFFIFYKYYIGSWHKSKYRFDSTRKKYVRLYENWPNPIHLFYSFTVWGFSNWLKNMQISTDISMWVKLTSNKKRPANSYVAFRIIIPKWNMYSLCGLTKKRAERIAKSNKQYMKAIPTTSEFTSLVYKQLDGVRA